MKQVCRHLEINDRDLQVKEVVSDTSGTRYGSWLQGLGEYGGG